MALRKFDRIGLRRDQNLKDLSNSKEALNNLLDSLVDGNSTFISEDLDVIRGISSSGINTTQYQELIDSAEYVNPIVTYQNKLDKIKYYSGNPVLYGGNGLTAKYYNSSQVFADTVGIFSGQPFKTDTYWQSGYFIYDGKITAESSDSNGGVEWEGYFIPTSTGRHIFSFQTAGCFSFDFQSETNVNQYDEIFRIGISTLAVANVGSTTNIINVVPATNTKFIAIGQSVSGTNISPGSVVSAVNSNNGYITLTNPNPVNPVIGVVNNATFTKIIGEESTKSNQTYILKAYEKYKIRFRYYIPQELDSTNINSYIYFLILTPENTSSGRLRYNYLYSLDYNFLDESIFGDFRKNSLFYGGGTVGGTTTVDDYVKVQTSKKIDIKYQPKLTVSEVIKSTGIGTISSGTNVLTVQDSSNIEIGNYVFGTGIPENSRVTEVIEVNDAIIIDQNATALASGQTYTFIDHRGFVKRATGSGSNNGTFSLSVGDTTNLREGMIMIGAGVTSYTRITTITPPNTFTFSPPQQTIDSTPVYFYQSKGLINNSLISYCSPIENVCITVSEFVGLGSTVIPVSNTDEIANNWYILGPQFSGGISSISSFVANTSITIVTPTIKNLEAGTVITATSVNNTNKSICCPPTDTSSPFNSSEVGLETPLAAPSLIIESGNLKFNSIAGIVSESNIIPYSDTDTTTLGIQIQCSDRVFKILCS
jgi:hypothetical protein